MKICNPELLHVMQGVCVPYTKNNAEIFFKLEGLVYIKNINVTFIINGDTINALLKFTVTSNDLPLMENMRVSLNLF